MLRALRDAWPTLVTGLALSVLVTGSAYLAENQSQQQRAEVRADITLKRALARLAQEANSVENALNYIEASRDAPPALPKFLNRLESFYLKPLTTGANWLWVKPYAAGDTATAIKDLNSALGTPQPLTGKPDGPLMTVFYAQHPAGDLQPGYNINSEPWVARLFSKPMTGPVFAVIAPGESKIWPQGALAIASTDGEADDSMLRIVPPGDLETITYLQDDQSVAISDQLHPGFSLGTPNPPASRGAATDTIPNSPLTFVSVPVLPGQPIVWIPVLLVSLMMTGLATVLHASQILRDRATTTMQELTGAQTTLADTRMSEEAFFETSGTANFIVDAQSRRIIRVNGTMCELLGYTREELLKKTADDITHPDDIEKSQRAQASITGNGHFLAQFEKRYVAKSGEVIWCVANSRAFRTTSGHSQFASSVIDISARKEAEMRRDDLVRELAHRVRNTVQLTASLARQTGKSAKTVAEYDQRFQERLAALKAAQDALFETSWGEVLLTDLAARTLAPFTATHGARLKVELPNLRLNAQQAQTMAIALHELAANSSVHGALGHEGTAKLHGQLRRGDEGVILNLEWEDHNPKAVVKPKRRGFGTQVLQSLLPGQFSGKADLLWNRDGLVYRAELPVSHQGEQARV